MKTMMCGGSIFFSNIIILSIIFYSVSREFQMYAKQIISANITLIKLM
jgi:hypothetical protein